MAIDTAVAAQSTALAAGFDTVTKHLIASAELVPEERYGFQPAEGVRSFLKLVAHVADGNDYYCRHALGDRIQWDDPTERGAGTRAAAIAALRESVQRCRHAFASRDADPAALVDNLAHANLHYGNVIVYLRLMGYVPPSS